MDKLCACEVLGLLSELFQLRQERLVIVIVLAIRCGQLRTCGATGGMRQTPPKEGFDGTLNECVGLIDQINSFCQSNRHSGDTS